MHYVNHHQFRICFLIYETIHALYFVYSGHQLDLKLKFAQTMGEKSITTFQKLRRITQVVIEFHLNLFWIAVMII